MATAIHEAKPSKKRAQLSATSRKFKAKTAKRRESEQDANSILLQRERDYAEAPEAPAEFEECPEARFERSIEAPDAGERRCDPSEDYFTHGRSWS